MVLWPYSHESQCPFGIHFSMTHEWITSVSYLVLSRNSLTRNLNWTTTVYKALPLHSKRNTWIPYGTNRLYWFIILPVSSLHPVHVSMCLFHSPVGTLVGQVGLVQQIQCHAARTITHGLFVSIVKDLIVDHKIYSFAFITSVVFYYPDLHM